MHLTCIPALTDNYIWVLNDPHGNCLIVDPGEAAPVLDIIVRQQWQPVAILLTHHHYDHTGGVEELRSYYPHLTVYGPEETRNKGATTVVKPHDTLTILQHKFKVIAAPGHTLGHLLFYSQPYLFCGDTLFSGGCGRIFEGTAEQMFLTFQEIKKLPDDTLICCAHEYTLSNMKFANAIWPENKEIEAYYHKINQLRAKNNVSVPSLLSTERKINVFMKTDAVDLQEKLKLNCSTAQEWQFFAELRRKKDHF
ncbi:hydroxyacylglutathione hydrolase [Enterobacteriaceae bacterium LUAb1]